MTSTYVTPSRLDRILSLPLALPQTELRRGRSIQVAVLPLALNESLEIKSLTLHLLKLLTPGQTPDLNNTALGIVSVGIYLTPMLTGSAALVRAYQPGATALNPYSPARFTTPGAYTVIASNNTANVDVAIIVTGLARWTR